MSNIDKGIVPGASFTRTSDEPLDAKSTHNDLGERNNMTDLGYDYEGQIVYVSPDDSSSDNIGVVYVRNDEYKTDLDSYDDLWEVLPYDRDVVHINKTESISGTKTFNTAPKIGAETVTTKEYVDNKFQTGVTDQVGVTIQAWSAQLDKLAALNTTGYVYRKADGTIQSMSITAADTTVTVVTDESTKTTSIKLPNVGTAGKYAIVNTDSQGRVTSGTLPTTVDGFGITDAVHKTGDILTGKLTYDTSVNLKNMSDYDIPPKYYVDSAALGYSYHTSCATGSTENIAGTYTPGTVQSGYPGVGATFTPTEQLSEINGVTLREDMRVMLFGQTDATQNGCYVVTTLSPLVLTRADDFDGLPDLDFSGATFIVTHGDDNTKLTQWRLINKGKIVFGTDPIEFVQITGPNAYIEGSGINISDNVVSVKQGNTVKVINELLEVSSGTGNSGKALLAGADNTQANWTQLTFSNISGTLPVNRGGTGVTTLPADQVLVGNGTSAVSGIANAVGVLIGSSTASPSFGKINISNGTYLSGVLPISLGGTGNTTGNSPTATKLATPFALNVSGALTAASLSIDGTADVALNVTKVDGTKVTVFGGASAQANGTIGAVPAPGAGAQNKALFGNGTWNTVSTTDNKVSQTIDSTNAEYPILQAWYNDGATHTSGSRYTSKAGINLATGAIRADGGFVGNLNGNVTGDVTGNLSGNVTGDVTGNLSGNANTASKLQTARTIKLTGGITGSAQFDGSGNITIDTTVVNTGETTSESAVKLQTARTIDGVNFDGTANITHYGVCSTAAATAAKVVSCSGFVLATGARIIVKFTVTNTATNSSVTLNVNNTGAKAIYYRGSGTSWSKNILSANRTYEFIYNGSQWEFVGDLVPGVTNVSQTATTTNANYPILFRFDANVTTAIRGTRFASSGLTANPSTGTIVAKTFRGALSGNATTATKLATKRNVMGVNFDGSANVINYAACSTAAGTAAKTASITNFALVTGSTAIIKFNNACTVANPTLNISNTGAKTIRYLNANITANQIPANSVLQLVYDGTYYQIIGAIPGGDYYTTTESDNRYALKTDSTIYNSLNIIDAS